MTRSSGCSSWCASKGGDQLFFVGDLLVARPAIPSGCLQLVRRTQARGVRGNHDDALLQWHRAHHEPAAARCALGRSHQSSRIGSTRKTGRCSSRFRLSIDLPEHELRIVHAGVDPGCAHRRAAAEALLSMRYLGPHNEPIEKGGTVLWGSRYVRAAPRRLRSQRAARAADAPLGHRPRHRCGLRRTTTAMVLDEGQEVPAVSTQRKFCPIFAFVRARRITSHELIRSPAMPTEPRYPQVLVDVPQGEADEAGALLFELGAEGIEERDETTLASGPGGGRLTLVATFAEKELAAAAVRDRSRVVAARYRFGG